MAAATEPKSVRADGRGHWRAGKRRSDAPAKLRRRLLAAIRRAQRNGLSIRAVGRALDVSDKTVRRWLAEHDYPDAATAERAIAVLRDFGAHGATSTT